MALRVWLPLRGNLDNQGLSQVTVTVSGSTMFNNSGKLGQSLTCNGSSYWTITPITLGNAATIACWTKTSTGGKMPWVIIANSSNKLNLYQSSQYTLNTGDGNANLFKDSDGNAINVLTDNIWHHFAVTFDGTVSKLYIDGIYRGTAMTYRDPTTTSAKTIYLAGGYGGGHTYDWNGSINDFRVYDHALSPEEVADIAKGLILWYPLNNRINQTGTNLLSTALATTTSGWNSWVSSGATQPTMSYTTIDGYKCCLTTYPTQSDGWSGCGPYQGVSTITANTVYTFSAFVKAANLDSIGKKLRIQAWNNDNVYIADKCNRPTFTLTDSWQRVESQICLSASKSPMIGFGYGYSINNGPGVSFYVTQLQWEQGDKAYPIWIPGGTSFVDTTIYDCSGYRNNGTIVGSLAAAAGSPKYDVATQKASGSYIRVDNRPNVVCAKDAITVSMWVNFSTWGNCISCTDGGGWNFEEIGGGLRFPVYISNVGYKIAQSTVTSTSLKNAWHMLTGTMDSNNIKFYIDGNEVGTLATGSTNGIWYANNYIFIGAEASGNNTSPENSSFVGTISDVRIYATALTAEQVAELYRDSMIVDASGNVTPRGLG